MLSELILDFESAQKRQWYWWWWWQWWLWFVLFISNDLKHHRPQGGPINYGHDYYNDDDDDDDNDNDDDDDEVLSSVAKFC